MFHRRRHEHLKLFLKGHGWMKGTKPPFLFYVPDKITFSWIGKKSTEYFIIVSCHTYLFLFVRTSYKDSISCIPGRKIRTDPMKSPPGCSSLSMVLKAWTNVQASSYMFFSIHGLEIQTSGIWWKPTHQNIIPFKKNH